MTQLRTATRSFREKRGTRVGRVWGSMWKCFFKIKSYKVAGDNWKEISLQTSWEESKVYGPRVLYYYFLIQKFNILDKLAPKMKVDKQRSAFLTQRLL